MTEDDDIAALEAAVGQAIAACDGDARAAVRALLIMNQHLEAEIDRLAAALSKGFVRGRVKPEKPAGAETWRSGSLE
jgi:hypothetical protein